MDKVNFKSLNNLRVEVNEIDVANLLGELELHIDQVEKIKSEADNYRNLLISGNIEKEKVKKILDILFDKE